jgi:hypothetical protein
VREGSEVEGNGALRLGERPIRKDLKSWIFATPCVVGCAVGWRPPFGENPSESKCWQGWCFYTNGHPLRFEHVPRRFPLPHVPCGSAGFAASNALIGAQVRFAQIRSSDRLNSPSLSGLARSRFRRVLRIHQTWRPP